MNARPLDRGCNPDECARAERQRPLESQRMRCSLRRDQRERDLGNVAFFTPQTGPERGVDDGFDGVGVRQDDAVRATGRECRRVMADKVRLDARRDRSRPASPALRASSTR